jgi:hypothetical protein
MLAPRKFVAYAAAIVLAVVGLTVLAVRSYQERAYASDMANLLAITGISGPKAFVLEPSEDLRLTLKKAKRNPSGAVEALQQALDARVAIQAELYKGFPDKQAPEARMCFENGLGFSFRIVLLNRWRPGMKREEIVKSYRTITQALKTQYDFKNHAGDFFGFE